MNIQKDDSKNNRLTYEIKPCKMLKRLKYS